MEKFRQPILLNPNRQWVVAELDKLHDEWVAWQKAVAEIVDHPYDPRTHSDVFADGEANMRHHGVLQAKTLTFLNTNIKSHGFIDGFDGNGCDRTDLRLSYRVKHRLHALDALRASLEYAQAPDSIPSPVAAAPPAQRGLLQCLGALATRHWQAAAKWAFGIAGTVLAAYLLKLIG